MIFKQIHNFPTGLNWGKIIIITLVAVGAAAIIISIKKNNSEIKKLKGNKPKE
jgi:hypothetical protein